jgi:hypothetical protein
MTPWASPSTVLAACLADLSLDPSRLGGAGVLSLAGMG